MISRTDEVNELSFPGTHSDRQPDTHHNKLRYSVNIYVIPNGSVVVWFSLVWRSVNIRINYMKGKEIMEFKVYCFKYAVNDFPEFGNVISCGIDCRLRRCDVKMRQTEQSHGVQVLLLLSLCDVTKIWDEHSRIHETEEGLKKNFSKSIETKTQNDCWRYERECLETHCRDRLTDCLLWNLQKVEWDTELPYQKVQPNQLCCKQTFLTIYWETSPLYWSSAGMSKNISRVRIVRTSEWTPFGCFSAAVNGKKHWRI